MNNYIFTRVSVFRNFKDYKFMPKLEKEKAQEIENAMDKISGDNYTKVVLDNADATTLKYLFENNLVSKNTKGVYLDKKNALSIALFEGEHLYIRSTGHGYKPSAIKNALDLAKQLSTKLNLAYSDEFGFLMSDITHLGCGLKLECDLDLNAINNIGKIEQVMQNVKKLGYSLTEKEANIYTLSTVCNLGYSETEIVNEFEKMISKLLDLEMESAKMLLASKHDDVMDKIMRSPAILSSAYLMNAEELKTHLSIIRTGLNLNLIEFDNEKLNKIQQLITNKNSEIAGQSELIELASNVRKIVKGEKDV